MPKFFIEPFHFHYFVIRKSRSTSQNLEEALYVKGCFSFIDYCQTIISKKFFLEQKAIIEDHFYKIILTRQIRISTTKIILVGLCP
jgi:hypothetical protein